MIVGNNWAKAGWFMIVVAVLLTVGSSSTRISSLATGQRSQPAVPHGFKLISHKQQPFFDKRYPHAAEIRFQARKRFQPVRLQVTCNQPVYSAAAVIELVEGGELVEGYAFNTALVGHTASFEFSEPPLDPGFVGIVEVRAPVPIRVLKLERVRGPVPPGTRGMDMVEQLRGLRDLSTRRETDDRTAPRPS